MKALIIIMTFFSLSTAQALTVVSTSGNANSRVATNSAPFVAQATPNNVTIQTSEFVNTFFGNHSVLGQQPQTRFSSINGVPYDVWMNGPVLSRYYNTNMFTANRNPYGINSTLPLNNQTVIVGPSSFGAF